MFNELKNLFSGNIKADCLNILEKYNKNIVYNHTINVASKAMELGQKYNLDTDKLETAAYLHDISAVIPREIYADLCVKYNYDVIELEQTLPILLHQKVSCIIAEEIFNITDNDILSAISCHTTLKPDASQFDMLLFIADKIMWDQSGTPPYIDVVENGLNRSLGKACLAYINYIIDNDMVLIPHPLLVRARKYLVNI